MEQATPPVQPDTSPVQPEVQRHGHYIGNAHTDPIGAEFLDVVDPSDGSKFAEIARGSAADVERAVRSARIAFEGTGGAPADGPWGRVDAATRGRLLQRWAERIEAHTEELARIESRDTGKPLTQARADARALVRYFEFYAGAADKLHGQTIPYRRGYTVMTLREPHGVTAHVIPWNYPMQIFGRSVGASLAAGNACVVKPAEDACLSLLRVAQLAADAGFPAGALNVVTGLGGEAGQALVEHAGVDHVSFTGSPETGRRVAQAAATHHCPVTLELGGKSPQLVFDDADLEAALPTLVSAVIQNAGQTCSAGSRVLVESRAYERVLAMLADRFAALRAGPALEDLDLGPLVSSRHRLRVREFVEAARSDGLRCAARGRIREDAPAGGYYQEPMLFADVPSSHRLAQEEIFGPVLAVTRFDDEAQAVEQANGTPYGLVAGIWTRDGARQLRLARRLRAGQVFVNDYGAGGGVELPFGGVARSGYGREKGFEALYAFTTLKTVAIRHD